MILRANGSYFNMGTKNARINIFDLKPISCDEDEEVDMYDTELAIYNVVEDIKIVLKYLYPTIKDETLSVIGGVAVETYKSYVERKTCGRVSPLSDYKGSSIYIDYRCNLHNIVFAQSHSELFRKDGQGNSKNVCSESYL